MTLPPNLVAEMVAVGDQVLNGVMSDARRTHVVGRDASATPIRTKPLVYAGARGWVESAPLPAQPPGQRYMAIMGAADRDDAAERVGTAVLGGG